MQILIGRAPANMDADRLREAWIRLPKSVFTGSAPT